MHITPAFLARLPTSFFPTHPTRAQFVLTGSCCHVQGLVTDARCQWWMPPRGALGQGGDRAQRAGSAQHGHSGSRANDTSLFPQKKERRSLRGQEEACSAVPCSGQPHSCCQGPGASAPALQQAPRHHEAETHGCLLCTRFLPSGSEWLARLPWLGSVLVLCRSTSPPRA